MKLCTPARNPRDGHVGGRNLKPGVPGDARLCCEHGSRSKNPPKRLLSEFASSVALSGPVEESPATAEASCLATRTIGD